MENNEKKIIIAERDNIAAIMEGKKVQEFYVTRGDILLGDIYLATVENILPSIEAAFVNVGSDKMGFLHTQDVIGKGALKDKLSPKQKLVVQVTKEPTGHKGPRVTTEISLPGRFLVLMPNETGINVSKKIENSKERARLKSIVSLLKPVGVGIIIRTEAENQSEADIQEDLE
ncbi:MAG: ribonuclease E/G, partial [bacterium]|nr:ribonuclease E/G [bacterium]